MDESAPCPRNTGEAKALEHEEKVSAYQYLEHEHEEKVNKYQAVLAARLKAKYFSRNAFDKGELFEEINIQSETIQLSRWPFTRSFADPVKFCREKSCTEDISPSPTTGTVKDNSPPLADQASLKK